LKFRDRLERTPRGPVRAGTCHRIERIRDMDNARRKRNVGAPQAKRITLPVGSLVVELDDREMWCQERPPAAECARPVPDVA
jgi:hypothetical protein